MVSKLLVVVRPREIGARDLGAEGRRNGPDLYRHGAVLEFGETPVGPAGIRAPIVAAPRRNQGYAEGTVNGASSSSVM